MTATPTKPKAAVPPIELRIVAIDVVHRGYMDKHGNLYTNEQEVRELVSSASRAEKIVRDLKSKPYPTEKETPMCKRCFS